MERDYSMRHGKCDYNPYNSLFFNAPVQSIIIVTVGTVANISRNPVQVVIKLDVRAAKLFKNNLLKTYSFY